MKSSIFSELVRLAPFAISLVLLGLVLGGLPWWLLTGTLCYGSWLLLRLHRLSRAMDVNNLRAISEEDEGILSGISSAVIRRHRYTSQRRARLSQMLDQYHNATQALPDGVVVIGETGDIAAFNTTAGNLLGLKAPADVGRPISNYLRRPEFSAFLERSDTESRLEIESPAKVGRKIWLRIVRFGKSGQRLMIVRDITRLDRLESVRRDFVANVSHELKTPLTVIQGYNENLQRLLLEAEDNRSFMDDTVGPVVEKSIREIQSQASRMGLLIQDLLELSRLEASDTDERKETEIDISAMLTTIRADSLSLAKAKHKIELDIDEGIRLRGYESELYSAFSNVILNALRYMDTPGTVTIRWQPGDDGSAELSFADEGRGIPAKDVSRVTERFYRVDQGRSREVGGTGLGLAIVKHVMIRHDADLTIESELNEGTIVRCVFGPERVVRVTADVIDYVKPDDNDASSVDRVRQSS